MDFLTAIKTCFSKYASFSGRATRPEFWYWLLFAWIGSILCGVVDAALFGVPDFDNIESYPSATVSQAFGLLVCLPYLAVGCRRLHDVGRSGWWQLLTLTLVGVVVLLYWWACKSQPDNKYGSAATQPAAQA